MRTRFALKSAFLCFCIAGLLAAPAHSQESASSLIRNWRDSTPWELQKWDFDAESGGLVQSWGTNALSLSNSEFGTPPGFAVGDWNGDGLDDLVVVDGLGITILGPEPAYYPLREATNGRIQAVLSDLDGDGTVELVIQRSYTGVKGRFISVWERTENGMTLSWEAPVGGTYVLLAEDVDNDGEKELISATDAVLVLERVPESKSWKVNAELPNIGQYPHAEDAMVDVVRVADVDSDGKNEILVTGNSGRLTVYKHFKNDRYGITRYPVFWQSPILVGEELTPLDSESGTHAFTQGLGVGDVDCDGKVEALVATVEQGRLANGRSFPGRIFVFEYREDGSFESSWISDWVYQATIPSFQSADLDGDGCSEFAYEGKDIYAFSKETEGFGIIHSFEGRTIREAHGRFGKLTVPTESLRIVPISWTAPRYIEPRTEVQVSVTLSAPWATAEEVTATLRSEDPGLSVLEKEVSVGVIGSGQTSDPISFSLKDTASGVDPEDLQEEARSVTLWLEVTARGYRQSIPYTVRVQAPEPRGDS